ncbi:sigma-70 family RNA polymerase sigma factor [Sphingomonas sp. HITSZ_GF]|uniref:sigma-70 family RNA polymerase sigma factor n=1 Tax=Sphingomonas sp. HITSZ_GF TaxID=3037247 RepID=UPI00240DB575|nr:sigma-70 family RNA polymerase sigma factor [Sphingomonas sp. HITSZ_GF]MDG2534684.1 sigma-70 family RNA polymerase sigma factor [Sphingomonas sp. HITSZ_GF]
MNDDAVMRRIAQRDAAAFSHVVDSHAERLHRIAWRMIGDAAEAEDVAQESLLRLWAQAGAWQSGKAGIGAWLNRVAMNLCLDRLRRRRFASDEEVPERADDSPAADALLDSERLRAQAVAALGALSERQRAAIVLTYYEELPNTMAATAMDMNLKAFESLLFRARAAMREALAARGLISLERAA